MKTGLITSDTYKDHLYWSWTSRTNSKSYCCYKILKKNKNLIYGKNQKFDRILILLTH